MIDFKKNFFHKNDNNKNYTTLLDVVKKQYDLEEGVFANINNDIASLDYTKYDRNIAMSYAYTRRTAAAGLFLQGVFDEEDYLRASIVFKQIQMITYVDNQYDKKNFYFQEKCAAESEEFIKTYDKRIDKGIIVILTNIVELSENRSSLFKISNYENLLNYLYNLYDEFKDKL